MGARTFVNRTFTSRTKINRAIIKKAINFDSNAVSYFNAMSAIPTLGIKNAINDYIVGLKFDLSDRGGGITQWQELNLVRIYCMHDRQAARLNLIDPSFAEVTEVSNPTWQARVGYTSDGSTSYLNQNWSASVNGGTTFAQDDCSMGVYSLTEGQSDGVVCGSIDVSGFGSAIIIRSTSNFSRVQINSTLSGTIGNNTAVGLTYLYKRNSTIINLGRNGGDYSAPSITTKTRNSLNHYTLCRNANGVASGFVPYTICFEFKGSGYLNQAKFFQRTDLLINTLRSL